MRNDWKQKIKYKETLEEHVFALFLGRGEMEVIVDHGYLRNIEAVQEEKQELVQSMER